MPNWKSWGEWLRLRHVVDNRSTPTVMVVLVILLSSDMHVKTVRLQAQHVGSVVLCVCLHHDMFRSFSLVDPPLVREHR
jgi:hypothetical protein